MGKRLTMVNIHLSVIYLFFFINSKYWLRRGVWMELLVVVIYSRQCLCIDWRHLQQSELTTCSLVQHGGKEKEKGWKITFPADFTGTREGKITHPQLSSPPFLLLFSSLFSSQPFEGGNPSLRLLALWLSDWWLHKRQDPSFTDKIFQIDSVSIFLSHGVPHWCQWWFSSFFSISWIKPWFSLHLRRWTDAPAYFLQYFLRRSERDRSTRDKRARKRWQERKIAV